MARMHSWSIALFVAGSHSHKNWKLIKNPWRMMQTTATDVDVLIVGAGPAGSAAAYDLCRSGKSVLLLDRHTFPRHKACAGGLTVKTLQALRYSVDPVIGKQCRDLVVGRGLDRKAEFSGQHMICAMTVRSELDAFCLEKAVAAGARFQTIGRIIAIRKYRSFVDIITEGGSFRAEFLIGADGAHSRVRNLSGEFTRRYHGFAIEGRLPCDPQSLPKMEFDFHVAAAGYGWLFTGSPRVALKKQDLRDYAWRKLGRKDVGAISGHHLGMGGWRYHPRCPRILLAGDAAGMVDPLLGEGLYNAVKSGQLAARAISTSGTSTQSAGFIYNRLLKNIRQDLLYCRLAALWFYRLPNFGHRVLTSRPVKYSLMKGFAMGLPLGRIGTGFFRLPFLTY